MSNHAFFTTVFMLLLFFEFKHLLCDFAFQNTYMLGKFKATGWVLPLSAHCLINVAGAVLLTLLFSNKNLLIMSAIVGATEFVTHFVIDRWKASPNYGGRYTPADRVFWINLGIDQGAHRLVNYILILMIVINNT